MRKIVLLGLVCFCLLLLLGLVGNFTPQVNATLTGSNFVEEITSASGKTFTVDVDSEGRIFLCDGLNDIWRSIDNGETWTKAYDGSVYTHSVPYILYVDSRDYIFATFRNTTSNQYELLRSINNGDSWATVSPANIGYGRNMEESSTGVLYTNPYDVSGLFVIYNSTDDGATWNNMTGVTGVTHGHNIGVAPNGYVFASFGDSGNSKLMRWNTTSWETLGSGEIWNSATAFTFIDDDAILYPNGVSYIYRFPYAGSPANKKAVWYTEPFVSSAYILDAQVYDDEVTLFGTYKGALWGGWDGYHWVKVWEDSTVDIRYFSSRRPIYFSERSNKKLWRVDIQKEDLIQLYYSAHSTTSRHQQANAENYVLEQRITNGTNYLDLTKVALGNVQASIKGLDLTNEMLTASTVGNSGFEWANATGWTISGNTTTAGYHWFTTEDKANGTTSLKIRKNADATAGKYVQETTGAQIVKKSDGDILVLSLYAKANTTVSGSPLMLSFTSNGTSLTKYVALTTSWARFSLAYYVRRAYANIQNAYVTLKLSQVAGTNYDVYIDSLLLHRYNVGSVLATSESGEEIFYAEQGTDNGFIPYDYHDTVNQTINPSLTINSQTVSHSGTLANGTESSATSLSGILTGAVQVDANIEGSGQAILKITGTRLLYEDSIILKGRKDNTYYGRYHGTFSPTITSTDLIAVTNLASNITSLSYSFNKLSLTINSPSNTTSTNKVYCGLREGPIAIYTANGTSTWSYNSPTTILALNVTHASPTRILVYWKFPGDIDSSDDVDVKDLYRLAVAYGSHVGELTYNSDSDINGDGDVDADDLYICVEDYGKANP